jgi:MscS family membrane protein
MKHFIVTFFKSKMPIWAEDQTFLLKNGQWIGLVIILIIATVAMYFIRFITNYYIKNNVESEKRFKSTFPFGLLAFVLTFKIGVHFLELDQEDLEIFLRVIYIMTAVSGMWAGLNFVDYLSYKFENNAKFSVNKIDAVLVPMIKKTIKALVVAFGALFVAHSLTLDVRSIIAGLGIGGVAVALAAKDTISNLFGSITVVLDRPFNIGDYIVLEKNIEGTVEQVGFRSTRIRTPINSLVTVPNSILQNLAIDNYGMRRFRRYKTFLQVDYKSNKSNIDRFVLALRDLVHEINAIDKKEMDPQVFLYEVGNGSIDILISLYFKVYTAKQELEERHQFIHGILELAESLNITFVVKNL